jgi:hypothetical protein
VILTFDPAVHYGFWFIREYVTAADDEAHFGGRALRRTWHPAFSSWRTICGRAAGGNGTQTCSLWTRSTVDTG